jgi:hypothetical protein
MADSVVDAFSEILEDPTYDRGLKRRYCDIRAVDAEGDSFSGYASTFWAVDSYKTAMAPDAFKRTLKQRGEVRLLLWMHDPTTPIGRTTSLKADKTGLAFTAAVTTQTQAGAEAMALLRETVPLKMSFGFQTNKRRPATADDPLDFSQMPGLKFSDVDIIDEAGLWEVSLVSFPANEAATITTVRSDLELDVLSTLLDATRAGKLDEAHRALMQQLVSAWDQRPGPALGALGASAHSTPEQGTRNREIDLAVTVAQAEAILSGALQTWQS